MPKKETRQARLNRFLRDRNLVRVDESAWHSIRNEFSGEAPGALRRLLRQSSAGVDPPYAGVDQSDLDSLQQSLEAIGGAYLQAKSNARPDLARLCRDVVIEAKDHARLASRNTRVAEDKRAVKQEMVQWMLVWLEDPAMFPAWVDLRKAARH